MRAVSVEEKVETAHSDATWRGARREDGGRDLSVNQPTMLIMDALLCLDTLCGGSLDGVMILALEVVQLATWALRFLACCVMLLMVICPTACLRVLLSRTSVSNGTVGSLFLRMLLLSGLAILSSSHNSFVSFVAHICNLLGVFSICFQPSPSGGSPQQLLEGLFHLLPALPVRGSPATCFVFFSHSACWVLSSWSFSEAEASVRAL